MAIRYEQSPELEEKITQIAGKLGLGHIDPSRVVCMKSFGSRSRGTLARIHVLPRILQKALGIKTHYVIEVISERFDRLPEEERTKTLLHELAHIPKSFGGGFRHHRPYVNRKVVDKMYKELQTR